MSISEIADNKWEVQAAKPPVSNVPAVAQMLLIASFAGITKAQLDDAMYQLTAIIRPALHDGFPQLAHLAARA